MQMPTGGVGLHIATRYCEFLLIESVGDLRHAIAVGEGLKPPVLAFEHADRPAEAALGEQRRQQAFPRRLAGMGALHFATAEIGREPSRERRCTYGSTPVVAVPLKKKNKN